MIERKTEFLRSGALRSEVVYGLSSLGADRSRVRTKTGPQLMASIRNLVISIFRLLGFRYIPDGVRFFAMRIDQTLRLLGI